MALKLKLNLSSALVSAQAIRIRCSRRGSGDRATRDTSRGFTLLELLAVILIIGILSAALFVAVQGAHESVEASATRMKIKTTRAALDSYQNEEGDFPASAFASEGSNNGLNVGVEAMVVSLWSNGREAGGLLSADDLVNTDADFSTRQLTDFGTKALLEVSDEWGNPLGYLHRRDYRRVDSYLTLDGATGELVATGFAARRNEDIGRYVDARKFQLVSAGPDGRFGTEDDIDGTSR